MQKEVSFIVVISVDSGCVVVETNADSETEARTKALLEAHRTGYSDPTIVYADKSLGCLSF